jgi:hypothetical protein
MPVWGHAGVQEVKEQTLPFDMRTGKSRNCYGVKTNTKIYFDLAQTKGIIHMVLIIFYSVSVIILAESTKPSTIVSASTTVNQTL